MNRSALAALAYPLLLGLLCGGAGFRMAWRTKSRFLLPLTEAAFGAVALASTWRAGGALAGAVAVAGWSLGTTALAWPTFRRHPAVVDRIVPRARPYRLTMLAWLSSGRGFASRATLRAHALELGLYLVAALVSGNLLGLLLGALLLNTMNAWVADLLRAARRPWIVRLLAWNLWSIVRVLAYVALGVLCAAPLAAALGHPADPRDLRILAVAGAGGVVLDLLLKLTTSRAAGRRLAGAVDLDGLERRGSETAPSEAR